MQVLKIQKKAYKEHFFYFQHRSGKVIATGKIFASEDRPITLL